jgi:hypothetical protein
MSNQDYFSKLMLLNKVLDILRHDGVAMFLGMGTITMVSEVLIKANRVSCQCFFFSFDFSLERERGDKIKLKKKSEEK